MTGLTDLLGLSTSTIIALHLLFSSHRLFESKDIPILDKPHGLENKA
ncbi:MAG: hypothetical protein ABIE47_15450 [Pseudomonadota bacterium]|nr:hypothetical protein [Desulfobacteraceae bacterium]MBL7172457.1 hypothetical protein [Desulfobacteraceae bacterium]MBU0989392.1 hypothetical protein [Pseudomonadota bacterium]